MRNRHPAVRRSALLLLFFLLTLLSLTGTASAHAQFESSDPPAEDVVASVPHQVTLTFGEPVEAPVNAVEVFDDHLQRVDDATVSRVGQGGNRIAVGMRPNLGNGTYTVSWHVSSADTHPVSGTFRFSVGAPSQVSGKVPGTGRNDSAGFLLGVMRGLGYAGLILGPGVLLVTLTLWPAGLTDRRTRRMLYLGLSLLGVTALGSMLLQGVWASSRPLSTLWSAPSTLDTHSRRFDTLYAVRFYLLVVFGVLLMATLSAQTTTNRDAVQRTGPPSRKPAPHATKNRPSRRPVPRPNTWRRALFPAVVASTVALMSTWTLAGHAAAGIQPPLAIATDLLHVAAMTVWLGGLALLTVSLRPAARTAELAAVLPRFSRLAFGSVVVLVASGSYQTWREVGSLGALLNTTFGQVLLAKFGTVIIIVGVGNLARRWVQRHLAAPMPASTQTLLIPVSVPTSRVATLQHTSDQEPTHQQLPVRGLLRTLSAELSIATIVLGLTAALVVTVPAREAYLHPFTQTKTAPGIALVVRVDASRVGDTVLHLTARSRTGRALPVTAIRGSLTQPIAKLGPLPLRLPNASGASRTGREDIGLTFPRNGNWVLQLTVQTSPLDATAFSFTVPVH